MKKDNSCYECPDREVGCHSKCEKYKEFRKELDKKKESINRQKLYYKDIRPYKERHRKKREV